MLCARESEQWCTRRLMDALVEVLSSPPSRRMRGDPGEWAQTCVSAGALCGGRLSTA